ncbi:MAG TPA: protein-L-isoaspartate O-methyltransferase [Acidiferrobacterales bacterium]|nr:protein-L-isoaspartate O-methyltransferase [Acidiferrobacterales bacterium]
MQNLPKLILLGVLLQISFAYATDENRQPDSGKASTALGTPDWTYEKFNKAFAESGRKIVISEKSFNDIQERKKIALKEIDMYLKERLGKADPIVMQAFAEIPREYFHYHYADKYAFVTAAYEEKAKPWAIGYGSALSDYLGQAYMTQLAQPTSESVVLEIGTGSGFQISLLSRIVKKAYSIEIIEPLGNAVAKIFKPLHYDNVQTRVGDGYFGWPEVREGFDVIIVTCAAQYVPPALFKQLRSGGRLVIPIGQPFKKGQVLYVYTKDKEGKIHSRKDVGVYFIPMTGAMEKDGG